MIRSGFDGKPLELLKSVKFDIKIVAVLSLSV